jgi:hypothetical protein
MSEFGRFFCKSRLREATKRRALNLPFNRSTENVFPSLCEDISVLDAAGLSAHYGRIYLRSMALIFICLHESIGWSMSDVIKSWVHDSSWETASVLFHSDVADD